MKHYIPLVFITLMAMPAMAQKDTTYFYRQSPTVIGRLSFLSPRIVLEFAPAEQFTLTTGFWLHTSLWYTNEYNQTIYDPSISPSFTFEPKYYFNLPERHAKGKRTDYYSGWYVGVPFNIRFPDLNYSLGAAIGFQCTMGKRWYWNVSGGPGFSYYDSRFHFAGVGSLSLGIILNKM